MSALMRLGFPQREESESDKVLSMPKRMRAAALELLERVRIGLDLPSRGEVLALAERLETISRQLSTLESKRAEDSMIVAALREEADNVKALGAAKAKATAKKSAGKKAKDPSAKKEKSTAKKDKASAKKTPAKKANAKQADAKIDTSKTSGRKVSKAAKAATKSATKAIAKSATRALLRDVAAKSAKKPAAPAGAAKPPRTIKKPTHGAVKATSKASGAKKSS